jgi:hypothetical protein
LATFNPVRHFEMHPIWNVSNIHISNLCKFAAWINGILIRLFFI